MTRSVQCTDHSVRYAYRQGCSLQCRATRMHNTSVMLSSAAHRHRQGGHTLFPSISSTFPHSSRYVHEPHSISNTNTNILFVTNTFMYASWANCDTSADITLRSKWSEINVSDQAEPLYEGKNIFWPNFPWPLSNSLIFPVFPGGWPPCVGSTGNKTMAQRPPILQIVDVSGVAVTET